MKRLVLAAVTITTMLGAAPLLAQPAPTRVAHVPRRWLRPSGC